MYIDLIKRNCSGCYLSSPFVIRDICRDVPMEQIVTVITVAEEWEACCRLRQRGFIRPRTLCWWLPLLPLSWLKSGPCVCRWIRASPYFHLLLLPCCVVSFLCLRGSPLSILCPRIRRSFIRGHRGKGGIVYPRHLCRGISFVFVVDILFMWSFFVFVILDGGLHCHTSRVQWDVF